MVREPVATRAHTEEMLAAAGADITVGRRWGRSGAGSGGAALAAGDFTVPGDPSQAAFWLVAGCIVPGSLVTVDRVYAGHRAAGFLGVLRRMGATSRARRPATCHRIGHHGYGCRCAARSWRRPRSPPSTRCPSWPWRPPAPTGPPGSGTWASSG